MLTSLDTVRLAALSACLPSQAVANDAKLAQTTGIAARRVVAPGTTVVDLCVRAAERALADTGSRPEEFGALVFVSFTQRWHMPSGAAQAQARLGLPKDIIALDVSLACSGWGYGLHLAGLLARQTGRKALLLDGDVQSAFLDRQDANTASLLSDGGTAAIVECDSSRSRPWLFSFMTDGEKGAALRLEEGGKIVMDGFGVFRFVATDVVRFIKDFLAQIESSCPSSPLGAPLPSATSLFFVPHQPNVYMVRQLAKSLGFDEGRTALSCDRFGNLASASVPVSAIANDVRGAVLFSGFGGGLSVSAGLIDIPTGIPLSLVEI